METRSTELGALSAVVTKIIKQLPTCQSCLKQRIRDFRKGEREGAEDGMFIVTSSVANLDLTQALQHNEGTCQTGRSCRPVSYGDFTRITMYANAVCAL